MIRKIKNFYHLLQAIVANIIYGFPSKGLTIIGVTGTDGKTTTTNLIYHILNSNHKNVSMVSTVNTIVAGEETDIGLHTTTPDPFVIQKLMKKTQDNHGEYFILEISSHAIDQNRIYGIKFDTAVLTNITHEHMDYHKTYENYAKTKFNLLEKAKIAIVNNDDESYDFLNSKFEIRNSKFLTYGLKNKADFSLDISKKLNLDLEEFNNYNYLAAYAVTKQLGLSDQSIFEAMKTFQLPKGRMDIVYNKEFTVIVDFANTPNAIEQVLKSIRVKYIKNHSRIIHVFGTPGKRDKEKRPLMGEKSELYADIIILTADDYRDEDPKKICEEIASGFTKKDKLYETIIDRKKAIEKAIQLAKKGDVIVLTGIGHQKTLAQGKSEIPWDEFEVARKAIEKRLLINDY